MHAAAAVGKFVLMLHLGLCLRLSFHVGLCLHLSLSLNMGLISPHLSLLPLLLLPEFLHELVIGAGTAVRSRRGHRRLRVLRGSSRLYLGARLTLCRPGRLKVVKMVEWRDLHRCHCRVP
jgi:hypothetical protein